MQIRYNDSKRYSVNGYAATSEEGLASGGIHIDLF